jgi:ABC-type proline/glycine betaine transport system permease subunit
MVAPDPALAPVMLPVIVPIVHAKLLAALAVRAMPGPDPLQVLAVAALVTAGIGLTVTVIVNADPAHDPVVDVGVTRYCTLPAVALLGLVNAWLIVAPDPALAPVMLPVIVPIVHAKLLGALAVNAIFGPDPLQVLAVAALVTAGIGLTVTVIVNADPAHDPVVDVGVTRYCTLPAVALLGLVNA